MENNNEMKYDKKSIEAMSPGMYSITIPCTIFWNDEEKRYYFTEIIKNVINSEGIICIYLRLILVTTNFSEEVFKW